MTGVTLTPQTTWSQYVAQIYTAGKPPVIGSYEYRLGEAKAREEMKDNLRACPLASAMRSPSIDNNIMPSCLHVYIWQRWDRQHVSQQSRGAGTVAHRPTYAT